MKRATRRVLHALAVAATAWLLSTTASGCLAQRQVVDIEDHPNGKVTLIATDDVWNYVFFLTAERVYWRCVNEPDGVICVRACGGDTGLNCAQLSVVGER